MIKTLDNIQILIFTIKLFDFLTIYKNLKDNNKTMIHRDIC